MSQFSPPWPAAHTQVVPLYREPSGQMVQLVPTPSTQTQSKSEVFPVLFVVLPKPQLTQSVRLPPVEKVPMGQSVQFDPPKPGAHTQSDSEEEPMFKVVFPGPQSVQLSRVNPVAQEPRAHCGHPGPPQPLGHTQAADDVEAV